MSIDARNVTPLFEVFDMPASIRFYRDVLGFEVTHTSEPGEHFDWAMLRLGGALIMLNTRYERDKRPAKPESAPGHADVALYFGCADVDAAYAELRDRGVVVNPPKVTHYGMKQLTLTDPDGFALCFQQPAEE